jgi:hypothetical protein
MFDFFDRDDEEMSEIIDGLIEDGYLIQVGYDSKDKPLYQTTPKFREAFPDFYDEQIKETNETVFELWNMGLIDMTVKEEINDWVVIPNKRTYETSLDGLTDQQRNMINYIRGKY